MERASRVWDSHRAHCLQAWIGLGSIPSDTQLWRTRWFPARLDGGRSRKVLMKEFFKIAVCAILVLTLAPVAGFWIVALVGAALLLLPMSAAIATAFPEAWKQIEDSLFSRTSSLSAS